MKRKPPSVAETEKTKFAKHEEEDEEEEEEETKDDKKSQRKRNRTKPAENFDKKPTVSKTGASIHATLHGRTKPVAGVRLAVLSGSIPPCKEQLQHPHTPKILAEHWGLTASETTERIKALVTDDRQGTQIIGKPCKCIVFAEEACPCVQPSQLPKLLLLDPGVWLQAAELMGQAEELRSLQSNPNGFTYRDLIPLIGVEATHTAIRDAFVVEPGLELVSGELRGLVLFLEEEGCIREAVLSADTLRKEGMAVYTVFRRSTNERLTIHVCAKQRASYCAWEGVPEPLRTHMLKKHRMYHAEDEDDDDGEPKEENEEPTEQKDGRPSFFPTSPDFVLHPYQVSTLCLAYRVLLGVYDRRHLEDQKEAEEEDKEAPREEEPVPSPDDPIQALESTTFEENPELAAEMRLCLEMLSSFNQKICESTAWTITRIRAGRVLMKMDLVDGEDVYVSSKVLVVVSLAYLLGMPEERAAEVGVKRRGCASAFLAVALSILEDAWVMNAPLCWLFGTALLCQASDTWTPDEASVRRLFQLALTALCRSTVCMNWRTEGRGDLGTSDWNPDEELMRRVKEIAKAEALEAKAEKKTSKRKRDTEEGADNENGEDNEDERNENGDKENGPANGDWVRTKSPSTKANLEKRKKKESGKKKPRKRQRTGRGKTLHVELPGTGGDDEKEEEEEREEDEEKEEDTHPDDSDTSGKKKRKASNRKQKKPTTKRKRATVDMTPEQKRAKATEDRRLKTQKEKAIKDRLLAEEAEAEVTIPVTRGKSVTKNEFRMARNLARRIRIPRGYSQMLKVITEKIDSGELKPERSECVPFSPATTVPICHIVQPSGFRFVGHFMPTTRAFEDKFHAMYVRILSKNPRRLARDLAWDTWDKSKECAAIRTAQALSLSLYTDYSCLKHPPAHCWTGSTDRVQSLPVPPHLGIVASAVGCISVNVGQRSFQVTIGTDDPEKEMVTLKPTKRTTELKAEISAQEREACIQAARDAKHAIKSPYRNLGKIVHFDHRRKLWLVDGVPIRVRVEQLCEESYVRVLDWRDEDEFKDGPPSLSQAVYNVLAIRHAIQEQNSTSMEAGEDVLGVQDVPKAKKQTDEDGDEEDEDEEDEEEEDAPRKKGKKRKKTKKKLRGRRKKRNMERMWPIGIVRDAWTKWLPMLVNEYASDRGVLYRVLALIRNQYKTVVLPAPQTGANKSPDSYQCFAYDGRAFEFLMRLSCIVPGALRPSNRPGRFHIHDPGLIVGLEKCLRVLVDNLMAPSLDAAAFPVVTIGPSPASAVAGKGAPELGPLPPSDGATIPTPVPSDVDLASLRYQWTKRRKRVVLRVFGPSSRHPIAFFPEPRETGWNSDDVCSLQVERYPPTDGTTNAEWASVQSYAVNFSMSTLLGPESTLAHECACRRGGTGGGEEEERIEDEDEDKDKKPPTPVVMHALQICYGQRHTARCTVNECLRCTGKYLTDMDRGSTPDEDVRAAALGTHVWGWHVQECEPITGTKEGEEANEPQPEDVASLRCAWKLRFVIGEGLYVLKADFRLAPKGFQTLSEEEDLTNHYDEDEQENGKEDDEEEGWAPIRLKRKLFDHQRDAVNDMRLRDKNNPGNKGHFLVLDTGYGKTGIDWGYLERLQKAGVLDRFDYVLFVCPKGVPEAILKEAKEWGIKARIVKPSGKTGVNKKLDEAKKAQAKRRKDKIKKGIAVTLTDDEQDQDELEDVRLKYTAKHGPLKRFCVNIMLTDHMKSAFETLAPLASKMLLILDEVDTCFGETVRTARAEGLADLCQLFIAQTATPFRNTKQTELRKWLLRTVPYPVDQNNWMVAASSIVCKTIELGIEHVVETVYVDMTPEQRKAYEDMIIEMRTGAFRWHSIWNYLLDLDNPELVRQCKRLLATPGIGRVLIQSRGVQQTQVLIDLLVEAGIMAGGYDNGEDDDYKAIVVDVGIVRGYNWGTGFGAILHSINKCSAATRKQFKGRLIRIGQKRSKILEVIVLQRGTVLEHLLEAHRDADNANQSIEVLAKKFFAEAIKKVLEANNIHLKQIKLVGTAKNESGVPKRKRGGDDDAKRAALDVM